MAVRLPIPPMNGIGYQETEQRQAGNGLHHVCEAEQAECAMPRGA